MKTIVLILISVFVFFGVDAQSKKVINQQLWGELFRVCKTKDSIETIFDNNEREFKYLRGSILSLGKSIMIEKSNEQSIRTNIKENHALLSQLGFDANTIVTLKDVDALKSPAQDKDYTAEVDNYAQSFELKKANGIQDLTDLKIKAQNEQLKMQIAEYSIVNGENKKTLLEEQRLLMELDKVLREYRTVVRDCKDFNRQLNYTSFALRSKYSEQKRIKEEQEELEAERKAIAAAKKSKSKKPSKIIFVPPVITEQEIDYEDGNMDSENVGSDGWDYAPTPEPEIAPPSPKEDPNIFEIPEELAEFPGGRDAMNEYMSKNLKYPPVAIETGLEGKCYLKFVISTTGDISNIKLMKGVTDCPECDQEAIRMLKGMPAWKPAMNNGKAVNSWYTIPVQFKLN